MRVNDLRRTNWSKRILPFIAFSCVVVGAMYPIFIYPYFHKEEYKKAQEFNRRDIDIETADKLAVRWSDPFKKKD